jgi:hypothetical protein
MIKLNDLRTELIEIPNDELASLVGGGVLAPIRSTTSLQSFIPPSPPKVITFPSLGPAPAPAPKPSVTVGFQATPGVGTQFSGGYNNGDIGIGATVGLGPKGAFDSLTTNVNARF